MLPLGLLIAATALAPQSADGPQTAQTPVLARTVEKGEVLRAEDFTSDAVPAALARGAARPDEAEGREALRRLRAGTPVRSADLVAPRIIRRGEAVTIALVSGPLRITTPGRALSDAAIGEPVRVINLSTNRTLEAVADKAGVARVLAQ